MKKARVAVVGAGGNIGSHAVPHLARMPEIGTLVLIDRDWYEPRNRANQAGVRPGAKAVVQAKLARALRSDLTVIPIVADVEQLPVGCLRADLIVAGVDNRRARQWVNWAARRLGVGWLDGGVLGEGGLARVTWFGSGADAACIECGWDPADYALLEQAYPCSLKGSTPARTGASSSLGGLAGSLLGIEAQRLLRGGADSDRSTELVIEAGRWQTYPTALRKNPGCRLGDHAPWKITRLPGCLELPLSRLARRLERRAGEAIVDIAVEGSRFAVEAYCSRCGVLARPPILARGSVADRCPRCRRPTQQMGFGRRSGLDRSHWKDRPDRRTLRAIGCRPGDVFVATGRSQTHYFEVAA